MSVFLGLCNSSCCAAQLALNALGIGCAGFAVLDPYRPISIAISAILVLFRIQREKRIRIKYILGMIVLSVIPEIVRMYNAYTGFVGVDSWVMALKQNLLESFSRAQTVKVIRRKKEMNPLIPHRDIAEVRVEFKLLKEDRKLSQILQEIIEKKVPGNQFKFIQVDDMDADENKCRRKNEM